MLSIEASTIRHVTVLTVLYNSSTVLQEYVKTWATASHSPMIDLDFLFVDHGPESEEVTTGLVYGLPWTEPENVRVHRQENQGFTGGVRAGLELIPSAHDIVLLNPDVAMPNRFWLELSDWLAENTPARMTWSGSFPLVSAGGTVVAGIGLSPALFFADRSWPAPPRRQKLVGPSGGALYAPANDRTRILDLWEPFFAWGEDADAALRAFSRGVQPIIIPIELEHLGGHSIDSPLGRRQKARLLYRNRILFWARLTSGPLKLWLSPVWAMTLLALVGKGLRDGTLMARLKGLTDAVRMLHRTEWEVPRAERMTVGRWLAMYLVRRDTSSRRYAKQPQARRQ